MQEIIEKARHIKLAVFDVDGVMTDGALILGESGDEFKIFNVHDGHGLVMLRDSGCHIAVITSRSSKIVSERMTSLGIEYVFQGQDDKSSALRGLMKKLGVNEKQTAYVGDDFIDLPAMQLTGLSVAVANAHPVVKKNADWITQSRGGHGAVREVCELILESQGKLQEILDNLYLTKSV